MAAVNQKAVNLLLQHMEAGAKDSHCTGRPRRRCHRGHAPDAQVARFVLSYLDTFGYLPQELASWRDIQADDIVAAIKDFQSWFGLPRTGKVCVQTVRAMTAPRCGFPEHARAGHPSDTVRQFIRANLPRWQKDRLTYFILEYVPGISRTDFESTVHEAFQAWTRHGNINVEPVRQQGKADILIATGQGPQSHFDGPGGTLAWAQLPTGRDNQLLMRFDADETWTLDPKRRGILLLNVACHEFGHLFGLDHSRVPSALMAPYYNAAVQVPQENDDIPRFQARYGARQDAPAPPDGAAAGGEAELVVRGRFHAVWLNGKKVA
jgi:hypothetical protein